MGYTTESRVLVSESIIIISRKVIIAFQPCQRSSLRASAHCARPTPGQPKPLQAILLVTAGHLRQRSLLCWFRVEGGGVELGEAAHFKGR